MGCLEVEEEGIVFISSNGTYTLPGDEINAFAAPLLRSYSGRWEGTRGILHHSLEYRIGHSRLVCGWGGGHEPYGLYLRLICSFALR